ncbi:MAG: hypothetical protein CFE27_14690 [Alphaproteobacteria bacterium PA1]|nr:MAG: hypothetical protein CFE27_14690 [Alphaproteobacteria bacterium PA1]
MTNITNEQLEAWAGLGPWLKQYSPTIDAMQIIESVERDLEGNVPIPRKIARVYEGQRMDMDGIKLHSDALAAAPALAAALLAERKAREVEVGELRAALKPFVDATRLVDLRRLENNDVLLKLTWPSEKARQALKGQRDDV